MGWVYSGNWYLYGYYYCGVIVNIAKMRSNIIIGRRILSRFIDFATIIIGCVFLSFIFPWEMYHYEQSWFMGMFFIAWLCIYYPAMEHFGGTLGKRICGIISVSDRTHALPSWRQVYTRVWFVVVHLLFGMPIWIALSFVPQSVYEKNEIVGGILTLIWIISVGIPIG